MIRFIGRRKRFLAVLLTVLVSNQVLAPSIVYALTSGPTQPEVQSFQAAQASDMVDLFSGDFSYNIPLFELPGPNGGYPFNLSYQSGIGMDQEASWVGLGWSLNPGAITRQMRGLPDEFKGDVVRTKMAMKPSVTLGMGAGVGAEIFGGDASLGVGFSVNHNNYKGIGYSIDASIGYGKTAESGMTRGIGLSVSLDSKEGINVSPSLSLGDATIGTDYNSKQGLQSVSLTMSVESQGKEFDVTDKNGNTKTRTWKSGISSTSSLTLAHPGYTPQITMPMKSLNMTASLKLGAAWWGIFGAPWVRGFYNEQHLKYNNQFVDAQAFGYMNYQHATDKSALMDFNREKDGIVTKEGPNLPMPSMTYDIYSVSGQGISAVYRPFRNDFGILRDPQTESTSTSFSSGSDIAPALAHFGVNRTLMHAKSVSGAWTGAHPLINEAGFVDSEIDKVYEPWYFKVHGEPDAEKLSAYDDLGGDLAVRVKLNGTKDNVSALATLQRKAMEKPAPVISSVNKDVRKPRNQVIQPITNETLLNGANQELISHFAVQYFDKENTLRALDRTAYKPHHVAGFSALTPEGLRYNYGIPAYNWKQEETTFSVLKQDVDVARIDLPLNDNGEIKLENVTDQFLKQVELPEYAHSHLLTSILGPDYVDVDNNGVSDKDLGYWVKFTYRQTSTKGDPYKWRDPYAKAHHQEGYETDFADDKASYTYGEKEMWYLAQAETKSHTATFEIEVRDDGRGVQSRIQNEDLKGASIYKLRQIKLFSKHAPAVPIKVVHFEFAPPAEELCKGVFNNSNGGGKLTLKQIHFEYGNSTRGALNPYKFFYHEGDAGENPNYDLNAYDRWGNYKPYPPGKPAYNLDFPYVEQTSSADGKAQLDKQAAAWSLKEIQLPSGGKVLIDYEIDDYAYVQHLPAMQMVQVVSSDDDPASALSLSDDNLIVLFKLEKTVPGVLSAADQAKEVMKYLDLKRKQVFFKYKINIRNPRDQMFEYISGYADINVNAATMGLKKNGSDTDAAKDYEYGYFSLKEENNRHPFSLRAWQHLRSNQPELANSGTKLEPTDDVKKRVKEIRKLGSMGTAVRQMFEGFYQFCDDKDWGRQVQADVSWVRLKSPDKIKYGGGLRVRQITMKDGWTEGGEGIYGQFYEYTKEENGQVISSGVAAYEPMIGGEENPLRYAKKYTQAIPLRSNNSLFFEFPVNESYYPGAQVGYSKVTVMSLAAANLKGKTSTIVDGSRVFPEGLAYGTTGMTVHEFYTAKDFPVIADETEKASEPFRLTIPIPLCGTISVSKLTASQGYSIVTNDMHGRQKMVSNFRQDPVGNIEPEPISWVKYNYLHKETFYDQQRVLALQNSFKDLQDGTLAVASSDDTDFQNHYTLGQETEFFYDMRQYDDNTWGGGYSYNTDVILIPLIFSPVVIKIPSLWPNMSSSTVQLRTAVTNKIVFKSGILASTEAFDGGSLIKTQNVKWNKQTGGVVLTKVNNNFDAPIYSFNTPAFTQYQGMGAAYKNLGLSLNISGVAKTPFKETLYNFTTNVSNDLLFPGDELLLFDSDPLSTKPICKVVYTGQDGSSKIMYSTVSLTATGYRAVIIRSGFRNQMSVSAGSITALQDPSVLGETTSRLKIIKVPR